VKQLHIMVNLSESSNLQALISYFQPDECARDCLTVKDFSIARISSDGYRYSDEEWTVRRRLTPFLNGEEDVRTPRIIYDHKTMGTDNAMIDLNETQTYNSATNDDYVRRCATNLFEEGDLSYDGRDYHELALPLPPGGVQQQPEAMDGESMDIDNPVQDYSTLLEEEIIMSDKSREGPRCVRVKFDSTEKVELDEGKAGQYSWKNEMCGVLTRITKKLKSIRFLNCNGLTDEILQLARPCKELEELYLINAANVTDHGFNSMIEGECSSNLNIHLFMLRSIP
jgi:hypothetical protein